MKGLVGKRIKLRYMVYEKNADIQIHDRKSLRFSGKLKVWVISKKIGLRPMARWEVPILVR